MDNVVLLIKRRIGFSNPKCRRDNDSERLVGAVGAIAFCGCAQEVNSVK